MDSVDGDAVDSSEEAAGLPVGGSLAIVDFDETKAAWPGTTGVVACSGWAPSWGDKPSEDRTPSQAPATVCLIWAYTP